MAGPPKTPLVTVDVIIEVEGGIVLIERKNPPPGTPGAPTGGK